jgi:hypothetical protein
MRSVFASLPQNDYADLVFHVLAHFDRTAGLPSSLYDPAYITLCRRELGPSEGRQLGAEIELLQPLLTSHAALIAVQRLAWLHESIEESAGCESRSLSELTPRDVTRPALLAALQREPSEALELLRRAVALERPEHARLPPAALAANAQGELLRTVNELCSIAPRLSRARIVYVRSLGRRGRVWGDEIWLGVPGSENGPTPELAAWQAAHEATVVEVQEVAEQVAPGTHELQLESVALQLLAARAVSAELSARHKAWFSSTSTGREPRELPAETRAELSVLLERFGL